MLRKWERGATNYLFLQTQVRMSGAVTTKITKPSTSRKTKAFNIMEKMKFKTKIDIKANTI
jgi:hypothetical protein